MQLPSDQDAPRDPRGVAIDLFHAVARAMRGADDVVGMSVVALLSGGHLLLEGQRRKAKYGVVTMCIGGGQGAAGLFEIFH